MPPAKLPKFLSRFIGGFRGVRQTTSLTITCAHQAPAFSGNDRGSLSMERSIHKLALRDSFPMYGDHGIQGPGVGHVGSAWLPACRQRSLSKVLPGFVDGVQGVRQTATILAISCASPTFAATNRELEGRSTQHISTASARSSTRQSPLQRGEGPATEVLENDGSAWLPACHLRSVPIPLSGFIAGIQGVKQTCDSAKLCLILKNRAF